MDSFTDPWNVMTFASFVLTLVLDANQTVDLVSLPEADEVDADIMCMAMPAASAPVMNTMSLFSNSLQHYRICTVPVPLSDEIRYWVKPRSTAWFSRFLLEQYDNTRWLAMFRMTKDSVFALADLLSPHVQKQNTNYRLAVPVLVRVACTLFKLSHGANLTICSEMFAIGRSTVCNILREVVNAVNDTLREEIAWPKGGRLVETQSKFRELCSLPGVVGVIDGVQISISKPPISATDYYFKSGGFSVNCQAVVDSEKRFLDLYVGMPGSTNDSRMLRHSSLYFLANRGDLMDNSVTVDGFSPYLIGDLGYPLLPWLMVPHCGGQNLSLSDALFNKKLRRGRCVVENAFGILKHTFRELLDKSDLQLSFLPDVIICCCLLHNVLLRQSNEDVEILLRQLRSEGLQHTAPAVDGGRPDHNPDDIKDMAVHQAKQKRHDLGILLSTRRRHR